MSVNLGTPLQCGNVRLVHVEIDCVDVCVCGHVCVSDTPCYLK